MTKANMHTQPSNGRFFLVYLVLFHVVWTGWVYGIYPWMTTLGETTLTFALVNVCLRLLIWVLPVFVYLHWIDHVDPMAYLKLKANWQRGLQIGIVLTIINGMLSLLRFGLPHPTLQAVTWNSMLSTSLLIGFVEEIPYRGFILQKLQDSSSFWYANLITSLLFVSIHLPGWISLGLLQGGTLIFVFMFSLLMGLVFRSSGSLWSVIVAHSLNDFLAAVIFRR